MIIITKSHDNYNSVGVMEFWLLNLLILIGFCVILVTCDKPRITCLFVKFGENLPRSFFEILKSPSFYSGDFKISKKWTR